MVPGTVPFGGIVKIGVGLVNVSVPVYRISEVTKAACSNGGGDDGSCETRGPD